MKMSVLTEQEQRKLLAIKGMKRLTRNQLADEIGVSYPTMTKVSNYPAPLVVNHDVHSKVITWLSEQATDSEGGN